MRLDNRELAQLRPITIERHVLDYAEGSALITVGKTRVLCAASIEEEVPQWLRNSGKGWITGEYSMLPRSTHTRTKRERTKVSGRTQEIQRLIGRSLRAAANLDQLGERTITLDCDVLQADGGTRTASITGAFVALADALCKLREQITGPFKPLHDYVAATSVGIVKGEVMLDLCYEEDSGAAVDMNLVATGAGGIIEVQMTAEDRAISPAQFQRLQELALKGVNYLTDLQRNLIGDLDSLF